MWFFVGMIDDKGKFTLIHTRLGLQFAQKDWKTTPTTVARPVCTVVIWDCWQWRFFGWCHLQNVNMFDGELACNLLFGGIYIFCGFWFRWGDSRMWPTEKGFFSTQTLHECKYDAFVFTFAAQTT